MIVATIDDFLGFVKFICIITLLCFLYNSFFPTSGEEQESTWATAGFLGQLFAMKFHQYYLMAMKYWVIFFAFSVAVTYIHKTKGIIFLGAALIFILTIFIWIIVGIIKGIKYDFFSSLGILSALWEGISVAWNSIIGFIFDKPNSSNLNIIFSLLTILSLALMILHIMSYVIFELIVNSEDMLLKISRISFFAICGLWLILTLGSSLYLVL